MLGIRMSFHIEPHKTWLVDGTMNWFWAEAERLQIPLMVLVPATSRHIGPVAERHPGLTLIVDHLGTPREVAGDAAWVDLDSLLGLAKYLNVYAKASCMPIYSEQAYPHRDLHAPLKRVYDAFGPQRMMWGTDLTRLPGTYRQAVTLFTEELPFLTAEDKEWVMGRTIAQALRWPEA